MTDDPDGRVPDGDATGSTPPASGDGTPTGKGAGSGPGEGEAPGALSDDQIRDALPDDLDAAGYVGPYLFPNNNRRRIPAILYWIIAAGCVAVYLWGNASGSPLVNAGFLWAAAVLTLVGIYSFAAGYDLEVDERDALVAATRQVGFPVGHASAQMGWRGLRSRPTWRILLFSAEEPPATRGFVLIDGVDGEVVEWFVEDNPEEWSGD